MPTNQAEKDASPLTWDGVKEAEENQLNSDPIGEHSKGDRIGLALSGGGIRSATFSLGVLHYLAKKKLLRQVDYLSTVSGGGYVGAWLTALIQRKRKAPPEFKVDAPITPRDDVEKEVWDDIEIEVSDCQSAPMRWIRDHSNYLTPRRGLSGDTTSTIGLILTNLVVSIFIVTALVGFIALIALSLGTLFVATLAFMNANPQISGLPKWLTSVRLAWFISGLFYFVGIWILFKPVQGILGQFRTSDNKTTNESGKPRYFTMIFILFASLILIALVVSNTITGGSEWLRASPDSWIKNHYMEGAIIFGFFYLFGSLPMQVLFWIELYKSKGYSKLYSTKKKFGFALLYPVSTFSAGIIGGGVLVGLVTWMRDHLEDGNHEWEALITSVPIAMFVVIITLSVHMLLLGWVRAIPNIMREWWHRVLGWLLFFTGVWLFVFGALVLGPAIFHPGTIEWVQVTVVGAWLGSSVAGVILAISRYAGKAGEDTLSGVASKLIPWVFVISIILLMFFGTERLLYPEFFSRPTTLPYDCYPYCKTLGECAQHIACSLSKHITTASGFKDVISPPIAFSEMFILLLLIAILYNVNWHSLYHLYRNRLVRCYLGASNTKHEKSSSRFDPTDDLPLSGAVQRPLHIFCTTLNLVGSRDLAWQTRKATSFFFTPIYCGYVLPLAKDATEGKLGFFDVENFVPTTLYMTPSRTHGNIITAWETHATIGTAMTISGAAMSPSCGYHTNPAFSFLMGLFNVRLGRWCPNPSQKESIKRKTDPRLGLWWFIKEVFGFATEKSKFIYLSDGGHFDNTGLYELVRRKCRYIVVVDGEHDPEWKFEGLTEAVRKCRLDLKATIEIDPTVIKPKNGEESKNNKNTSCETGYSKQSYAVGKVLYDLDDKGDPKNEGTLIYIKLSLPPPNELRSSIDVLGYKAGHPQFPHEPTSDQWFSENQFESYQQLGEKVAFQAFGKQSKKADLEQVIEGLVMKEVFKNAP